MRIPSRLIALAFVLLSLTSLRAEDGYRLWQRYDPIADQARRARCQSVLREISFYTATGLESPTISAARNELKTGLRGLLGIDVLVTLAAKGGASTLSSDAFQLVSIISAKSKSEPGRIAIIAETDLGILYGAFDLLRRIQTDQPVDSLEVTCAPKIQRRLLNHWDSLNRMSERGYAGFSLWEWFYLPEYRNPRYRDYARACASLGINGTVLTNVNADARILTPIYLGKVAALAEEFRPYGVRVYLSARFTAPMELGGLKTADPLDPAVAAWWRAKIDEIYQTIPDFGGFIVKANSEGQPGPQDYHRTHADGANMLADALAPHGGIVMWRAFVYRAENTEDRAKHDGCCVLQDRRGHALMVGAARLTGGRDNRCGQNNRAPGRKSKGY